MNVVGTSSAASASQPRVLVLRTARSGTGSSRAGPSGLRRARRSRSAPGSRGRRRRVRVCTSPDPCPPRAARASPGASSAGPVAGSSIRRCAWVRFDSGRKMLPLVMKRCSRSTRESTVRRVDHRDTRATVVGEHDHRLEAEHVRDVVLEHLGVAHEAVAPPERLVGEAEAREVHRADPVAVAQPLRDLEPVDAARREAVHQHERRRRRVTELDVEAPAPRRHHPTSAPREAARPCHATAPHDSCA